MYILKSEDYYNKRGASDFCLFGLRVTPPITQVFPNFTHYHHIIGIKSGLERENIVFYRVQSPRGVIVE